MIVVQSDGRPKVICRPGEFAVSADGLPVSQIIAELQTLQMRLVDIAAAIGAPADNIRQWKRGGYEPKRHHYFALQTLHARAKEMTASRPGLPQVSDDA